MLLREIHRNDAGNTAEINALEYFQTSCYMHILSCRGCVTSTEALWLWDNLGTFYVEFKLPYNFLKMNDRLCSQIFRAGNLTWSQQNALRMVLKVRQTTRTGCHHPGNLPGQKVLHWLFPQARGEMQKQIVWLSPALAGELHYSFSCLAEVSLGVLCTHEKEDKKLRKGCRSGPWPLLLFSF